MKIQPAPGLLIRDPKTKRLLPEEGLEVKESTFWLRRLKEGDVVLCAPDVLEIDSQEN